MKKLYRAFPALVLVPGLASAAVFDITTTPGVSVYNQSVDTLTNTAGATTWGDNNDFLRFAAGSDVSGVDIAGLGVTDFVFGTSYDDTSARNFSAVNMSGMTISTNVNNGIRTINFTGANFSGSTFDIGTTANTNQPFLNSTIAGADFTNATFNWDPFTSGGADRLNLFRQSEGTGTAYSNANFSNATFNISLSGASAGGDANNAFFNDGPGSLNAATAANALSFVGVDFNFLETTGNSGDVVGLLIDNLGGTDGGTNIGAFYDDNFVANNFADFGFDSEADLNSALLTAGWQVVPEPSSLALIGLTLGAGLVRRRRA